MDCDRKISKPKNILFIFILFGLIAVLSSISGLADTGRVNVTLDAGAYNITKDASGYDVIVMDGFSDLVETGDPMLPQKTFDVLLPPNYDESSLQLKIVSAKSEVLTGTYDIKPSPEWLPQNSNDTVIGADSSITTEIPLGIETAIPSETVIKTSTYETDADYPENYVYLLPNSQMRKWMFVPVNFIPFQYNPVTKKLIFYESVTIEISFAEKELSLSAEEGLSDTVFDDAAPDKFINYNEASGWYGSEEKAKLKSSAVSDYVIVTTNAIKTGSSKLNSFVAHKQALGYSVQVVTESDYDALTGQAPNLRAEKIRQWLKNNYLTKGIEYVLLIGNPIPYENGGADIPMKMCYPRRGSGSYEESPTDYFYADLTGNWDINGNSYYGELSDYQTSGGVDLTADVYVGRIPVYGTNYASLDSILQKIINYETQSSTSWRKSALLPMSFSDASTDGGYLGERMKDAYLVPNGYSCWRMYQHGTYGSCTINSAFSSEEALTGGSTVPNRWVNSDFGIVCWWGHGNSQGAYVSYSPCSTSSFMLSSNAPSLDDAHPSHTYQCSCLNGQPEDSSNLQYAILKKGGITTTGATRVSWYYVGQTSYAGSPSNAGMGYEYVKRLVQEMPAGEALYRMKSSGVYQPGGSAEILMNFYVMCLDGDPSVGITNPIFVPTVTNSGGATAITTTSARLNGEVTATGGENPTVHVYWGDNDGDVTSANWDNDVNLGALPAGTFNSDLSGLTPGKTYYYRCYASNSAGGSWAGSTASFETNAASKLIGADDAICNGGAGAGNFHLCRFQATSSGDVNAIKVKALTSGNLKVAIYADSSGAPGALLSAASTGTSVSAGWNTINIPSITVNSGTYYWLAFNSDVSCLCLNVAPGLIVWKAAPYGTFAFPSEAGSGFAQTNVYTALIAGWSIVPSQDKLVGADDAICNGGAGPGNFHLCRFQATGSGDVIAIKLKALTSGNIKVAIYADSSGAPGALLSAAPTGTSVSAGWNYINIPSIAVTSGAYYWLAFNTDVGCLCLNVAPGLIAWKAAPYGTFAFPSEAGTGYSQTNVYMALIAGWSIIPSEGTLIGADDANCNSCVKAVDLSSQKANSRL